MTIPTTAILKLISESPRRLAVDAVVQTLSGPDGFRHRELRRAIRQLVESGELNYSYELGNSFLERSFNRPVAISERIILSPPGHKSRSGKPQVIVTLAPGAAFGYGQHPSTRMALKAIDAALSAHPALVTDPGDGILDLGTGSGVLVIAAVLLGIPAGKGVDIDPCARSEAARNVTLNGLEGKIRIDGSSIESQADRFALVTANLRRPTLELYRRHIARCVRNDGMLIISGIKIDESEAVLESYTEMEMKLIRAWDEKAWAAILMQKVRSESLQA